MADADEDAIHLPSSHDSAQVENDLSDETQDFRFLNHLALYVLIQLYLMTAEISFFVSSQNH